jgi:hypothetical protein
VAGDEEYRSEEALPLLARLLATHHGFRCTVLFSLDPRTGEIDPENQEYLPGLAAVDEADLLVLFLRFRRLPDADMEHLVRYVESGRPLLGIRTATHAFAYPEDSPSLYADWSWNSETWPGGFGRQVLGETWVRHHGRHGEESTRGVIPAGQEDHPVLRGVSDLWGFTDVYAIRDLPGDATVLVEGEVLAGMTPQSPPVTDGRNDPRMPVVWLRERPMEGGEVQRIACSTLGASVDLHCEDLRRLLVNACYWAVGLEARIPDRGRVDLPEEPPLSMFGFGSHLRGVRPADLAADS